MRSTLLFAVGFFFALIVLAMCWRSHELDHGVSLSESEKQIRASILKMTPLGTSIEEVKASIHTRMHPDTFYNYENINLPGSGTGPGGKMVWSQWPLGGEHHGNVIVCQIGSTTDMGFIEDISVNAYWAFDNEGHLADVFVYKVTEGP
jgi:hypothetical protein